MTADTNTIIPGTRIAIPVKWEGNQSGCVEWTLVNWGIDDTGKRFPVCHDGGDNIAWVGDYAAREPGDLEWRFPDGESCYDKGLVAAFAKRSGIPLKENKPNRAERRALERQRKQVEQAEEVFESLEAQGKVTSVICEDGEKRWILRNQVH